MLKLFGIIKIRGAVSEEFKFMNKDLMQKKYGKPKRFSDPYKDFGGEEKELAEIISKSDEALDLRDFGWIFQMYLPAADYKEGLYFIPLCFELMEKACPFEANVCNSLFWYIEHFKEKLKKDSFYEDCIKRTEELFEMFTKDFIVADEYQPNPKYRLSKLKYGLSVDRIVSGLAHCEETWEILSKFLFGLKDKGDVGSCWWFIISFFVRNRLMYVTKRSFGYKRNKIIFEYFHKFGEYSKHWEKARIYTQKKGFYSFLPQFAIIPFEIEE